ncbi:MAG: hypothetical protein Ta2D_09790 [Rickettsiales bacterium]|nr:MAG: hypothetical protein Ta2D_09790 [Rickettsiales bacterium]
MKKSFLVLLFVLVSCSSPNIKKPDIVLFMPDTNIEMTNEYFWIKKAKNPTKIIMTRDEIDKMNKQAYSRFFQQKLSDFVPLITEYDVEKNINHIFDATFYNLDGDKIDSDLKKEIIKNIDIDNEQEIQYGIVVKRVMQKYAPTSQIFIRKNSSKFLDRNIVSSIDINEPVLILRETSDRQWYFVISNHTIMGWVKAENVALTTKSEFKKLENFWESPTNFAVITKHNTPIFQRNNESSYYDLAEVGDAFKIIKSDNHWTSISVPVKDYDYLTYKTMYVKTENLHKGYVPYTSANALKLAFSFINSKYGWGGDYGEQDCSGFLVQIFKSFGIFLPRNSYSQSNVGTNILNRTDEYSKKYSITTKGIEGATFLYMRGHIMLYIGEIDGEPYIINSIWSFEEDEKEIYAAQVVVSTLNLGRDTKRKSFIERLSSVKNVKL